MENDNRGLERTLINLIDGKWWRSFNLMGMRLKLKEPLSKDWDSKFKGDRNYITITGYCSNLHASYDEESADYLAIYAWTDWVMYKDDEGNYRKRHSVSLELLDYDYFIEQLTKNV